MTMKIGAIGSYLPPNTETASVLREDNPDWAIDEIQEKTGVLTRYIAGAEQTATDMAEAAANTILQSSVDKEDLDFLILVTQSPDYFLPTSACILQDRLSLKQTTMAFDINLGCSGFVYGLAIAHGLIAGGTASQGLLICSDTYSKYISKHDRTCRPLFSDGAAATHLIATNNSCVGSFDMGTNGAGYADLMVPAGAARHEVDNQHKKQLKMNGANVFMFTMKIVPRCVHNLLAKSGQTLDDIDLFIFHQASKLVIDNIIRHLKLTAEKVFTNYRNIGNTVSATIPIALADAVKAGRLKEGDQVMLVGFGVGLSWGGCIIRWSESV